MIRNAQERGTATDSMQWVPMNDLSRAPTAERGLLPGCSKTF